MPRQPSTSNNDSTLWEQSDAASVDVPADRAADLLRRANNLVTAILSSKRFGWLKSDREDYRQDVLLSLLSKLKRLNEPGVEPIKDYDAYVVKASLNHFRRRKRTRIEDPATESTDSDDLSAALVDAQPSPEEALVTDEAVRIVWRECVALMNREQLALFLFDRNDILWRLIGTTNPISVDEIAETLGRTPPDLAQIMKRLPCKNDRELAQLMGVTEQRVHKVRMRMKPLLKRIRVRCGYRGRISVSGVSGSLE
jgi:RNA polymerase sigma factor (sigma-70 family)